MARKWLILAVLMVQHCLDNVDRGSLESAQPPGEGADPVRIGGKVEF